MDHDDAVGDVNGHTEDTVTDKTESSNTVDSNTDFVNAHDVKDAPFHSLESFFADGQTERGNTKEDIRPRAVAKRSSCRRGHQRTATQRLPETNLLPNFLSTLPSLIPKQPQLPQLPNFPTLPYRCHDKQTITTQQTTLVNSVVNEQTTPLAKEQTMTQQIYTHPLCWPPKHQTNLGSNSMSRLLVEYLKENPHFLTAEHPAKRRRVGSEAQDTITDKVKKWLTDCKPAPDDDNKTRPSWQERLSFCSDSTPEVPLDLRRKVAGNRTVSSVHKRKADGSEHSTNDFSNEPKLHESCAHNSSQQTNSCNTQSLTPDDKSIMADSYHSDSNSSLDLSQDFDRKNEKNISEPTDSVETRTILKSPDEKKTISSHKIKDLNSNSVCRIDLQMSRDPNLTSR